MITVGVAAYNASATLPALLDSLAAQECSDALLEVIIADNGSTDSTRSVVESYRDVLPIRLVDASHRRGPAAARNRIVATARGEIIAFTDADCAAHPDWLHRLDEAFVDPTVGCVAGAILADEPKTSTERFYARRQILGQEWVLAHPFLPYAQTANAAFRTDLFRQLGGFDEDLITCEDADMLWRMQIHTSYRLVYRPEAVVWHHHRSSPRGLLRQATGWGMGHALVYKKYGPRSGKDSASKLLADYRLVLGLAGLTVRRWLGTRLGTVDRASMEDAYLAFLFHLGLRIGRWKGSISARVLYL